MDEEEMSLKHRKMDALKIALKHCRGHYQEAVVRGWQNWSGSDLRGKAKSWSGRYATSRSNLFSRLNGDPRLKVNICIGPKGKKILQINLNIEKFNPCLSKMNQEIY